MFHLTKAAVPHMKPGGAIINTASINSDMPHPTDMPTPEAVLGTVSLITWSLIVIISLKYAVLMLRADNRGDDRHRAVHGKVDAWIEHACCAKRHNSDEGLTLSLCSRRRGYRVVENCAQRVDPFTSFAQRAKGRTKWNACKILIQSQPTLRQTPPSVG
jgi:NAD(P)-dependent dehydrogenase (short-subunit alcohol dehydrogenase family)